MKNLVGFVLLSALALVFLYGDLPRTWTYGIIVGYFIATLVGWIFKPKPKRHIEQNFKMGYNPDCPTCRYLESEKIKKDIDSQNQIDLYRF